MPKKSEPILQNPKELDKLAKLREKLTNTDFPEDLAELDTLDRNIKEHLLRLSIEDNEGVKLLLQKAREEILAINKLLTTEPEGHMDTTADRAVLFEKRKVWLWFISFFVESKKEMEEINKRLDDELSTELSPDI